MATAPPSLTAPGLAPDPNDRATFNARAYAWTLWEKTNQVPEQTALAANVYANAVDAYNQGVTAVLQAAAAAASATAAAASATAAASTGPAWVSGTTYTLGQVVYSPLNFQSYRRAVAGAGTLDPSADPANWTALAPQSAAAAIFSYQTFGGL